MATISFKAKVRNVYFADDSLAYQYIAIPKTFTSAHFNRADFRFGHALSGLANSDLFPRAILNAVNKLAKGRDAFRLDSLPEGVTVDQSGFLAVVTVTI